jgi:hypothetical protein
MEEEFSPPCQTSPIWGTYLEPFSCDKKILEAVLNQLSKMDSNIPNIKRLWRRRFGDKCSFRSNKIQI